MKNKFILLELNQRNEIRADVNLTIKSLGITEIENINVKIDTGCPYTSIPVRKLGISNEKAQKMKQADSADPAIKKEISFGVNDTKEKRETDKEKFRTGKYMELQSVTFQHESLEIDFGGICLKKNTVKVSYDRTGNILIGMDLLSQMDIHIGQSRILGKTVFLACPYDMIDSDYLEMLDEHFGLQKVSPLEM